MIRATRVLRAGHWSGIASDAAILSFDERYRRRFAIKGAQGLEFLLDLPEATVLRNGDGLVLEDSRMVEVRAKPEPLLVVRGGDPQELACFAWHIGNRHVPAAIESDLILIRPDHVIAAMLVGLGAEVSEIKAPFDPRAAPMRIRPSAMAFIVMADLAFLPTRLEGERSADISALLKLLTFLSPAFPVGSFSYSHGLEWLIAEGGMHNAEAIESWIVDLLELGSLWNDAVLLAEACRAASEEEPALVTRLAELACALAPSRERQLETLSQGTAFLNAVSAAWPCFPASRLLAVGGAAYPIAVGACAAAHRIRASDALPGWLNSAAANLVSVAVRLIRSARMQG